MLAKGLLNFFIGGEQIFFSNRRSDIEHFARMMVARQIRPELEVYSSAVPSSTSCWTHQRRAASVERLVTSSTLFRGLTSSPSRGRSCELPITTIAIAMGLNTRVGMEDNVYYRRGELLYDNAQLVSRTVMIANELGHRPLPRTRRPSSGASVGASPGNGHFGFSAPGRQRPFARPRVALSEHGLKHLVLSWYWLPGQRPAHGRQVSYLVAFDSCDRRFGDRSYSTDVAASPC